MAQSSALTWLFCLPRIYPTLSLSSATNRTGFLSLLELVQSAFLCHSFVAFKMSLHVTYTLVMLLTIEWINLEGFHTISSPSEFLIPVGTLKSFFSHTNTLSSTCYSTVLEIFPCINIRSQSASSHIQLVIIGLDILTLSELIPLTFSSIFSIDAK